MVFHLYQMTKVEYNQPVHGHRLRHKEAIEHKTANNIPPYKTISIQ